MDDPNAHPINQHALKLLVGWNTAPRPDQLHILTLAAEAQFATLEERLALRSLLDQPPRDALTRILSVGGFAENFLADDRPLESAKLFLRALSFLPPREDVTSPAKIATPDP